jgi:hypothetical protein
MSTIMSASPESISNPAAFLSSQPLTLPDGRPNPAVNGNLCPAALRVFEQAELAPQEFETFVEALRRLLPVSEPGTAAERFASATDEALDLVARLLNKEPNPALDRWANELAPFIDSEADAGAALAHLQNTLALYSAVINAKYGD